MPSLWQFDRRPLRFVLLVVLLVLLASLAVSALAGAGPGEFVPAALARAAKPDAWLWN